MNETKESKSPRDTEGHGTHTASTAAGSVVPDAGYFQYARGEARGMATKARIAAYKVCWNSGCYDSDILAAMDQAIEDGVHVISLSVGSSGLAPQYYKDSIAIGGLHAAQSGVLLSCSAGNSGPGPFTAVNIAPWILTVGASTLDREFPANVVLGDGRTFNGVSLYSGDALNSSHYFELVSGGDCGSKLCLEGTSFTRSFCGVLMPYTTHLNMMILRHNHIMVIRLCSFGLIFSKFQISTIHFSSGRASSNLFLNKFSSVPFSSVSAVLLCQFQSNEHGLTY